MSGVNLNGAPYIAFSVARFRAAAVEHIVTVAP